MTYDAVILAGGQARRLGGVSKPAIAVGGRRLLDIALDAVIGAERTIVVGAALPTARPVEWAREDPPGGGPVAALAAALPFVQSRTVVVLAADLPFITAAAVEKLVAARGDAAAAIAVDDDGRDQPLIGCYDAERLRAALPVDPIGASMRSLLSVLAALGALRALGALGALVRVTLGGEPPITLDCDTADDLTRARELA
jgi:molybdopterin-guanine dinucleotide biosynthesis protein A